jgi:hypothetical protein
MEDTNEYDDDQEENQELEKLYSQLEGAAQDLSILEKRKWLAGAVRNNTRR